MAKAKSQVVMTFRTTTEINGVLKRMGMVSFLEISLCVGVEKRIVVGTLPIPQTFMVLTSETQLLFDFLKLILI